GAKIALYPHAGVTSDAGGLSVPQGVGGATRVYLFAITYSGAPISVDLYLFSCEQVRRGR
ncbi:MAG: hypothetical protein MUC88_23290, partial [Planctomycetes bacterium]|nr:hypothetical protein [Planctomycetota bacterium]